LRVPVVDARGVPLMPCTPAKARHLLKEGKACAKWSRLGLFHLQLFQVEQPANQPIVVGIDPGSRFEGYSVVGTRDTIVNLMSEAPTHVKQAIAVRRRMRRARRFRKWRRPCRTHNRLARRRLLPPSTRSRWEAKARVVRQLQRILPLTDAVVEEIRAPWRRGHGGRWNSAFGPLQIGKRHLYAQLEMMGLQVHLRRGWETSALRERFGLRKAKSKSQPRFSSHAVDAWAMAADVSGAERPTCTSVRYLVCVRLHRRQLHALQPMKGGVRRPYGGTRSLGMKRGTLVEHSRHGLCAIGGADLKRGTVSLHEYRSNRRLTRRGRLGVCVRRAWVAFRSWDIKERRSGVTLTC
jgi:RRXRR protein